MHGFRKYKTGTMSFFVREFDETRVVSHVDDPRTCAEPVTLDKIWIAKLVVLKRGETLTPRIPVVCLGFEYCSIQESERRGFTVKPTTKYVDESCLELVQFQNAKLFVAPLTEQKSANLHDAACDQVQHALFRPVVGKLEYNTGVRPDLLVVTKCLSYKLASPTLADLTRATNKLGYLKRTRHLNLHLTIRSTKPTDLSKKLKNIMGYSDADWNGDPMTRKNTSCTLCHVDQFFITRECKGQGTVALSSGESELKTKEHCHQN